jgi:hypothetical protein
MSISETHDMQPDLPRKETPPNALACALAAPRSSTVTLMGAAPVGPKKRKRPGV